MAALNLRLKNGSPPLREILVVANAVGTEIEVADSPEVISPHFSAINCVFHISILVSLAF